MKRKFLRFDAIDYILPPDHRRKFMRHAHRNNGGGTPTETPTEEDEAKAIAQIGEQVKKFSDLLGDKADKSAIEELTKQVEQLQKGIETMQSAEVTKLLNDINKNNEALWKQVVELQEQKAEEKEKQEGGSKPGMKIKTSDVEAFVKTVFGKIPDKDDNLKSLKRDHMGLGCKIEITTTTKAAENFAYATFFDIDGTDSTALTGRVVDPVLYQRRRKRNLILDNFPIRTINVPVLLFLVKVEDGDDVGSGSGDSGGAAWIDPGEIKPKRSFKVTTGRAEAKEVAIFGTVEDKLLRDVPSLENWIREDFMDEMREEINDGLLNNDPAVNDKAPLGLKTDAVQYSATPGYSNHFTANTTNYIDQIFAIAAKMSYDRETPGVVFVATDVYYLIRHLKDNDNRYLNNNLVYVDSLGRLFIGGMQVVEADYEDIPATNFLAVSIDPGFKIFAYGPMVFERGLNGEDFRYDRTSYRGYQEFLTYLPTHRENSVMYDTWANVKAAIEA